MVLNLKWKFVAATLGLVGAVGLGTAEAANLLATEVGDFNDLVTFIPDTNWDRTPFTFSGSSESTAGTAVGSGAYFANMTATGSALVVLTEGPGGATSDWLRLDYSGGDGAPGTETVLQAMWVSDFDFGGPPFLPTDVTPEFLGETGGV
jgi:hypothetical protein